MAKHLSKRELGRVEITDYKAIRDSIETGYLAFMSGSYPISKAIQTVTKSPWSHVGILFNVKDTDRIMILESVENMGVRLVPFTEYTNNYDGEVVVCNINAEIDIKVLGRGWDLILKSYDKPEFLRIIERIIRREGKVHHNDMYICSELVEEVFEPTYKFQFDKRGFVSPENLFCDSGVELLWRVK